MKFFGILAAAASADLVRIPIKVNDRLKHAKRTAAYAHTFSTSSSCTGGNCVIEVGFCFCLAGCKTGRQNGSVTVFALVCVCVCVCGLESE